jgi:E3 ubiquitin-protein ligase RFWD2
MEGSNHMIFGQKTPPAPEFPLSVTEEDLICPICLSLLTDPFATSCGHTFCYTCISTHLLTSKNCPSCSHFLTIELTFPNFLLSKVGAVGRARSPTYLQSQRVALTHPELLLQLQFY